MSCRPAALAGASMILVLILATPALAGDVSVQGDEIVFVGGAQENHLSISEGPGPQPGQIRYGIRDAAGLTAGPGCEVTDSHGNGACALPDGRRARLIRADLGPGLDLAYLVPGTVTPVHFIGGDGVDFMAGGAGADRFDGGPGDDTMYGDHGPAGDAVARAADDFVGGEGTDRVSYAGQRAERVTVTIDDQPDDGAPGEGDNVHSDVENVQGDMWAPNRLTGSNAANVLRGGDANDVLIGGGGSDSLYGDRGDDTLEARDSGPDSVSCGEGTDSAIVDFNDGVEPGTCERVDSTPPPAFEPRLPPPPGPPPPPLHGTFPVTVPATSLKPSRSGRVTVRLACGANAGPRGCSGTVRLASVKRVRIGSRKRTFSLGAEDFVIPAGQAKRLTFKLSRDQRRALKRLKRVELLARVVEAGTQPRDTQRSITLRR